MQSKANIEVLEQNAAGPEAAQKQEEAAAKTH